jgi:dTDP-4-dehydrorhamnose reductase
VKPVPAITVFGANGQLGHALERVADARGMTIISYDRNSVDITEAGMVADALARAGSSLVVNAAAYTAVDRAESEEQQAFRVNCEGARNIAEACARGGMPFIHVSTDYVFDGSKPTAWLETDPVSPISAYGRSKEAGERAVREACPHAMIFRTAWVFGVEGANFVKTMLRLGRERDTLRVVDDQRGCPTFADDLATAIIASAARYEPGTYHVTGMGETTWCGFAREIFRGQARPVIQAITTADYPTPAKRPANSVLDGTKARTVLGVELPHWADGLKRMLSMLDAT